MARGERTLYLVEALFAGQQSVMVAALDLKGPALMAFYLLRTLALAVVAWRTLSERCLGPEMWLY